MRILKWPIQPYGLTTHSIPQGVRFLTVQAQDGVPCVWGAVDENTAAKPVYFYSYATGEEIPEYPGTYLGTFQLMDGALVYHVFFIRTP